MHTYIHTQHSNRFIIIGHSNGGPTAYTFLDSMTDSWKEKYIAGFVSLSGNFLGQMNGFSAFFPTTIPQETFSTSGMYVCMYVCMYVFITVV